MEGAACILLEIDLIVYMFTTKRYLSSFLRYSLRTYPLCPFSSFKNKVESTLQKLTVETEEGKVAPLMSSGVIVAHNIDEVNSKITISLNLNKDYRRIKSLIKS